MFSEFAVPTLASLPLVITVGPDGQLWFTEFLGNNIGRLGPVFFPSIPTLSRYWPILFALALSAVGVLTIWGR